MTNRRSRPAATNREALRRWGFVDRVRDLPAYTGEHYDQDVGAGAIEIADRECPRGRQAFGACTCGTRQPEYYRQRVRHKRREKTGFVSFTSTRVICYDAWLAAWWHSTSAWREVHADLDAEQRASDVLAGTAAARQAIYGRHLQRIEQLAGAFESADQLPEWWEAFAVLESVARCLLSYELARERRPRKPR